MGGSGLSEKVATNTKRFREGMTAAGFQIMGENHPIAPVFLGDAKMASVMAEKMLSKHFFFFVILVRALIFLFVMLLFFVYLGRGIYVIGFSYPVVPKGKARIRVLISAAHSDSDIDRTVEAFTQVGRELGVIS